VGLLRATFPALARSRVVSCDSRGRTLSHGRSAHPERTGKRCDDVHARSTLGLGVSHLCLTTPLSYAAGAFHLGPCEKFLRYGKRATSSCILQEVRAIGQTRHQFLLNFHDPGIQYESEQKGLIRTVRIVAAIALCTSSGLGWFGDLIALTGEVANRHEYQSNSLAERESMAYIAIEVHSTTRPIVAAQYRHHCSRRVELARHGCVSLVDNSTDFIGMCDVSCKPLFLNDAGLRLVDWAIGHKP